MRSWCSTPDAASPPGRRRWCATIPPSKPPISAGPAAARCAGAPLLEVDGLSAGYGPLAVLDNVSLKVGRGEVIALFGPNGAGKSTLMKALSGLIRPVKGRISLGGKNL